MQKYISNFITGMSCEWYRGSAVSLTATRSKVEISCHCLDFLQFLWLPCKDMYVRLLGDFKLPVGLNAR